MRSSPERPKERIDRIAGEDLGEVAPPQRGLALAEGDEGLHVLRNGESSPIGGERAADLAEGDPQLIPGVEQRDAVEHEDGR